MTSEIVRLDTASRRRSLFGYCLGLAVYSLVVVALDPAFKDSTSLDQFVRSDATAAAVFGVVGDLTSAAGWLNGNIFANFFPLVMLLLTIGYGAAAIAGQDEEGTLCLLVTLPIRRTRIVYAKAAAMVVQAVVFAAAVAVCVIVGRVRDGRRFRTPRHAGRRPFRAAGHRDRGRCRPRRGLLPGELNRARRIMDSARSLRVAVLLGRRTRPDRQRRESWRRCCAGLGRRRPPRHRGPCVRSFRRAQ